MLNHDDDEYISLHITHIIIITICDRAWEKGPLRAQYDFSVEAFVVYLTNNNNNIISYILIVSPY